ncbi:unnamed protein product [Caenorhabditis angaria]|uniref:Uncharacterized protein n=1 Tax=Caenorhabditis angaria TaxID=860376 RepID=A0A9P1I979_9PELO|nr:unnamed protein product [Caenorhabditis angaria]
MCQFLENDIEGIEGDEWLKNENLEEKFKLRGLFVSFRHGERSSFSKINDEIGCRAHREIDRKNFEKYKELVNSEDFQTFLKVVPALSTWPKFPEDEKCSSGQLTAEGALQHVKLGKFFRKQYAKSSLFTEDMENMKTRIVTSKYNRTFQSVLAFSSEFFFKQRNHFLPITIKASNHSFQCVDQFCNCKLAKKMRIKYYEQQHLEYFENLLKNDRILREETEFVQSFDDFSSSSDPFKIIDVALGKYICRRKPLPCKNEKCLTNDYLNKLIDITTLRGQKMYNSSGISKRLHLLEAWPVLSYLKMALEKMRVKSEKNYIRVFSGHDVLIAPLLRVLGIPFVDPPHYTSRLVFEIYEHSEEGLFIRVLFNGFNRSADVSFCNENNLKFGMCRASAFETFMQENLYFGQIGVENFSQACEIPE